MSISNICQTRRNGIQSKQISRNCYYDQFLTESSARALPKCHKCGHKNHQTVVKSTKWSVTKLMIKLLSNK